MPLPVVCNVSLTENSVAISVREHSQAKVIDLCLSFDLIQSFIRWALTLFADMPRDLWLTSPCSSSSLIALSSHPPLLFIHVHHFIGVLLIWFDCVIDIFLFIYFSWFAHALPVAIRFVYICSTFALCHLFDTIFFYHGYEYLHVVPTHRHWLSSTFPQIFLWILGVSYASACSL